MSDLKCRKATAEPRERTEAPDTEIQCGGHPSDATAAAELDGAGHVAHLVRVFESGHGSATGRPEQDRSEQDLLSTESWRRLYTPTKDDPHLLSQAPPPVDTHVVPPPAVDRTRLGRRRDRRIWAPPEIAPNLQRRSRRQCAHHHLAGADRRRGTTRTQSLGIRFVAFTR
jgi:hypothetical protein